MVQNLSRGWRFKKVQTPQEGGFSGTGGSDNTGYIAFIDGKINIL